MQVVQKGPKRELMPNTTVEGTACKRRCTSFRSASAALIVIGYLSEGP
jgi:hypothetical protein